MTDRIFAELERVENELLAARLAGDPSSTLDARADGLAFALGVLEGREPIEIRGEILAEITSRRRVGLVNVAVARLALAGH